MFESADMKWWKSAASETQVTHGRVCGCIASPLSLCLLVIPTVICWALVFFRFTIFRISAAKLVFALV